MPLGDAFCVAHTPGFLIALAACLVAFCAPSPNNTKHANRTPGLVEELAEMSVEHCMSTWQLREAIRIAAWNADVTGVPRSAIILTSCSTQCMQQLFQPFMWAVENNRDGDFSKHVVIVGNGIAAYVLCDNLRHKHKHHCVLDRMCPPHGSPMLTAVSRDTTFRQPLYLLALLQKVFWAREVIRFNISVLWADMDTTFFGNPLLFLFNAAPDADLIVQSEFWDQDRAFAGDVCKARQGKEGCGTPGPANCCRSDTPVNGGQWLINPTANGTAIIESWAALLFEDGVVHGRIWDSTANLDQGFLNKIISVAHMKAPLFKWDSSTNSYLHYSNVTKTGGNIYRISAQRAQSACIGPCGFRAPNTAYTSYFRKDHLVCVMPKKHMDRMISFHQNCKSALAMKRSSMMYFLNWSIDETLFVEKGEKVIPDW